MSDSTETLGLGSDLIRSCMDDRGVDLRLALVCQDAWSRGRMRSEAPADADSS